MTSGVDDVTALAYRCGGSRGLKPAYDLKLERDRGSCAALLRADARSLQIVDTFLGLDTNCHLLVTAIRTTTFPFNTAQEIGECTCYF